MRFDVRANLRLCYRPNCRAKVPSRPQVLSPVTLLQVRKLFLQQPRGAPFEVLHHLRRTQARRARHQQVDVVFAHVTFQNLDVTAHAALSDEFPRPLRYLSPQHVVAVLRDPHKVVLDVIERVRPPAIFSHQNITLSEGAKAFRLKAKVSDPAHGNEITVIPELLEIVTPAGAVVTTDAMGCQKHIAWTAREHHAHYLLALKDNHPKLYADVQDFFDYADEESWELEHSTTKTVERAHGRDETRECWVLEAPEWLHEKEAWRDLRSIVRLHSQRTLAGHTGEQTRYFLTSLPIDAERALRAARYHWGIENGLHWVLDVAFDEDRSRARLENAQATWVALRHLAVNLLKRDKTLRVSVEAKRKRAGWDRSYLLKLLRS